MENFVCQINFNLHYWYIGKDKSHKQGCLSLGIYLPETEDILGCYEVRVHFLGIVEI